MPTTNLQLTPQEIHLLLDLGLDSNSPTIATQIQELIDPTQDTLLDLFPDHYQNDLTPSTPLEFSPDAQNVFDAGRELWRYYHSVNGDTMVAATHNVNASLYDIREYFQGRNEGGKMNNKSADEKYSQLITNLRDALKVLGLKIQPKVYEYGFLKR